MDHSTNEELVGEALEPFRGKVVIATNLAWKHGDNGLIQYGPGQPDRSKSNGLAEASLNVWRVEAIDLFYQHRPDPNVPIEEVAGAVKDLIKAGKVKHFGLSESTLTKSGVPMRCNPLRPCKRIFDLGGGTFEDDILPTLEELGIGLVPTARWTRLT